MNKHERTKCDTSQEKKVGVLGVEKESEENNANNYSKRVV